MRMSCNGCRVLRKGCSESCSIRPCLQWIKIPESQSNATVFLAKFYGRAGLMNLINAGPDHIRPAIFRSLLYEACGRIVNPIYGSVGLLWSGNWQLCQNAVEAVLKGAPITPITSEVAVNNNGPPLKLPYDIRHINKDDNSTKSSDLHRVRTRCRFKRSGSDSAAKLKAKPVCFGSGDESVHEKVNGSTSHESSLSHQSHEAAMAVAAPNVECDSHSREIESLHSAEMAEAEESTTADYAKEGDGAEDGEIELKLTLGFANFDPSTAARITKETKRSEGFHLIDTAGECKIELGLHCPK